MPMDIDFYPPPNPALTAIFNGNQLRGFLLGGAQRWKSLYVGNVARGDDPRHSGDRLHQSAHAFTEKVSIAGNMRWAGVLEVRNDHVLPHNFGWETERDEFVAAENELNEILGMLTL